MQLTMSTANQESRLAGVSPRLQVKVTYGVLILALGLMLTDFCRLMRTPSDPALSAANSTHHAHKF
jgi:hypothetical protein